MIQRRRNATSGIAVFRQYRTRWAARRVRGTRVLRAPETAGDGCKEDILKENGLPADIRQPQPRRQVAENRAPPGGTPTGKPVFGQKNRARRAQIPPPVPAKGN